MSGPGDESAGYWTVEDGRPYWVDAATQAHFHPATIAGGDFAEVAWSSLADVISQVEAAPADDWTDLS